MEVLRCELLSSLRHLLRRVLQRLATALLVLLSISQQWKRWIFLTPNSQCC